MESIENADVRLSRSIEDLEHMSNTLVRFCNTLQTIPYFATLGNEVVIWVDHNKCSELFVISHWSHPLSSYK